VAAQVRTLIISIIIIYQSQFFYSALLFAAN
jgi:hypothetical protein